MTGEPTAAADPPPTFPTDTAHAASPGQQPATAGGTAGAVSPHRPQPLLRRTVLAVIAIVVMCVPFAVFTVINHEVAASSWALFAGVTALVNYVLGGRGIGYLSVGLLTALTPVAIVSGAVPLAGAGLMAIMCYGVGHSAARGLHRGMLLIPLFLAWMIIAPPPWGTVPVDRDSTSYLLWNMLIWGGGALWAVLVFPPLLRKMKPIPPEPNSRSDTVIYTVTITVLCTLSTLAVLIWWPGSNGAWLVVTLLAITQVGHVETLQRTTARVGGTVIGAVAAAALATVIGNETVLLVVGLILVVVAVVVRSGPHYWLYMAFMTPAVVVFSSTSVVNVELTDAQRLSFTLIGAGLVLLASGITVLWARHQQGPAGDVPGAHRREPAAH